VLSGLNVNPYLVDAIIGLSVCYKALENLGKIGFFGAKLAVFGFGLIHGFGLSTKLQDLVLSHDGLVVNMIFFNIGVETGQIIALTGLLLGLFWLRAPPGFERLSVNANVLPFGAGLILFGMKAVGFLMQLE